MAVQFCIFYIYRQFWLSRLEIAWTNAYKLVSILAIDKVRVGRDDNPKLEKGKKLYKRVISEGILPLIP